MLKLSSSLYNIPIISFRTNSRIGTALRPLLNPNNLKIEGWYASSIFEGGVLIVPSIEVREITGNGVMVNDQDAITPIDELIRLQPLIKLNFKLEGKVVVTESKKKLGKVTDYATEMESYFVQKLFVRPSAIKFLASDQLTVYRNQIVEITDSKVIVRDIEATERAVVTAPAPAP